MDKLAPGPISVLELYVGMKSGDKKLTRKRGPNSQGRYQLRWESPNQSQTNGVEVIDEECPGGVMVIIDVVPTRRGRPPVDPFKKREQVTFYVSIDERAAIRQLLRDLRAKEKTGV